MQIIRIIYNIAIKMAQKYTVVMREFNVSCSSGNQASKTHRNRSVIIINAI